MGAKWTSYEMDPTVDQCVRSENVRSSWLRRTGWILLIILVSVFIIWISLSLPGKYGGYVETDFFDFWAGGRAIVEGKDPYNPADWSAIRESLGGTWVAKPASVYPLPVNLFFVPLSLLPIAQAASVWLAISQLLILVAIYLCIQSASFSRWKVYLVPILAGVALFRPAILTVRNGQLSAILLAVLSLAIWLWAKGRFSLGGFVIGFLTLKPSVAITILPFVCIWLVAKRRWGAIVGLCGSVIGLMGLSLLVDGNWIIPWLSSCRQTMGQTAAYMPTLWGLTAQLSGQMESWSTLGMALFLVLTILTVVLFLRTKAFGEIYVLSCLVLPMAIFMTPHIWNYDQVLLIISMIFLIAASDRIGIPFLINGLSFLVLDCLAIALLALAAEVGHDVWSSLVPLSIVGLALSLWQFARRKGVKPWPTIGPA
jgi:hypothetical protein